MDVKQIYSLVNTATNEAIGETAVVQEDLTGLVDTGEAIFNAQAVDRYVRSLVNQIGRIVFVNRPYRGRVPSVLMDGWEFGSVLEKISSTELPDATINETWELQDGQSYDPNIFYKPKVVAKFFNSKVTFEIDRSYTEKQVKQSFQNATQMNAFLSMLYNDVDKSMTVKLDALIMRTINNMTAATLADAGSAGNARAVNLLKLYNTRYGTTLSASDAITTPEFIRFAVLQMSNHMDRIATMSTLFNMGGMARFTPKDLLHIVMLSDFRNAADVYLQSDTFHNEYTRLPEAETVPYWQGSGLTYEFEDISSINVKTSDGDEVSQSGILCVMFDRDALGVQNPDRRVTTNWNPSAEFWTNFYKWDAGYFNDYNENFVVFYVADSE